MLPSFPNVTNYTGLAEKLYPYLLNALSGGGAIAAPFGKIMLIRANSAGVSIYDVTAAGLTAALAAASAGDAVWIPPCTLVGNWTVPASVGVQAYGKKANLQSTLTGTVILGAGAFLNSVYVNPSVSSGSAFAGVIGPASGTAYLNDCSIIVTNTSTGNAYGVQGGSGALWIWNCYVYGNASGGGSGYGIYQGGAGETNVEGGWLRGSTAPTVIAGPASYAAGAEISTGAATVTADNGVEITGLTPGNYYAVEAFNGPWNHGAQPGDDSVYSFTLYEGSWSGDWRGMGYGIVEDKIIPPFTYAFQDYRPTFVLHTEALDANYARAYFQAAGTSIRFRNADKPGAFYNDTGTLSWRLRSATFTPAIGSIVTNAVRMDPVGGEPAQGDRGVWDATDYPTRHANDFAVGDSHHPAMTLASDADEIMAISGQEISLQSQDANTVLAGPTAAPAADPDFRVLVNADLPNPLALLASSILTLASDAVTVSKSYHIIAAETGTTDNLATINGSLARQFLMIQADAGDTITVKHGTGNIFLNGAADFSLTGDKTLLLFYDGTNWSDTGAGGGGGGGHEIKDEGTPLTQRAGLNFVGAGVTVTDDAGNDETDVSIPSITVKEQDATPSVSGVTEIRVTNGTLTDEGGGAVSLVLTGGTGISTNTAAYASRPAAGNTGDLFLPTDGFVIERDTGAAWIPWGPIWPLTSPVDGDFAWVNQGGASVSVTNGGVFLSAPAAASYNLRIRKKAKTPPYKVDVLMYPYISRTQSVGWGIGFRQSSDGKMHMLLFQVSATPTITAYSTKFTNPTTVSATYTSEALNRWQWQSPVWWRIEDNNTNRIISYSLDGYHWWPWHTIGRTDFLTADEVLFVVDAGHVSNEAGLLIAHWKES